MAPRVRTCRSPVMQKWEAEPVDWSALLAQDDGVRTRPGATEGALALAESEIGCRLPDALRRLYLLTDGVFDEPGQWFVIWPLAEVVRQHQETETAPPPDFIGFGDDGTGSPFCVKRTVDDGVYYWSPLSREATRVADDVPTFWAAWIADALPPH